ncbi:hypothetical protein F0310_02330 [Borrelia sp. A-FGy1]|nr:hypothetical protein F0310_02330 [Borrelia sp. A-FGy1]
MTIEIIIISKTKINWRKGEIIILNLATKKNSRKKTKSIKDKLVNEHKIKYKIFIN